MLERVKKEALLTDEEIKEAIWLACVDSKEVNGGQVVAQAQLNKALNTKVYKDYTIKDLIERGLIVAENQELPQCSVSLDTARDAHYRLGYAKALDDIRNSNFVRVIPKEGE